MKEYAQKVWKDCLSFIKDNIDEQPFNTFFVPLIPAEVENNTLKLILPSDFYYKILETEYIQLLRTALKLALGENAKLTYLIAPQTMKEELPSVGRAKLAPQSVVLPIEDKSPEIKNPFVIPGIREITIDPQLNLNHNFDNFIEGNSNILARSAGVSVANRPGGTAYNPLLIFGGVGLGKTHLAHAIGVDIKEKFPKKKVLYVSAEKFTQQFISASSPANKINGSVTDFIHFYQLIDVLIVDDIQFLSGKAKTQEAFFHILNHLHQNNKQVILTSDKAPVDMIDIEIRLLSRFKWGLQAELQLPDYQLRYEIIKHKFLNDGAQISDEVIDYLAKNLRTNIREIEGISNSLMAQATFARKEYTIELAQSIIEKNIKNYQKEISIDEIQHLVASYFQLGLEELQSQTRKRNIVQARQLAMYFAKKYTKSSLMAIGSQIGKRDHATVLHACKTVENLIATDRQFKQDVEELVKKITN